MLCKTLQFAFLHSSQNSKEFNHFHNHLRKACKKTVQLVYTHVKFSLASFPCKTPFVTSLIFSQNPVNEEMGPPVLLAYTFHIWNRDPVRLFAIYSFGGLPGPRWVYSKGCCESFLLMLVCSHISSPLGLCCSPLCCDRG